MDLAQRSSTLPPRSHLDAGSIEHRVASYLQDKRGDAVARDFVSTITTTVKGYKETLAVTYSEPTCAPGSTCAPASQYWLPVGTVTLTQEDTEPTPLSTTTTPAPSAPASKFWLPAGLDTVALFSAQTRLSTTTITFPSTTVTQVTTQTSKPVYVFLTRDYFIGAFLPTLLAVLFALPWLIIDATVRRVEPYHQLANSNGAVATKSLCADYSSQFTAPFKALFSGHLAPILTSMLSFTALLITPLATETVSIRVEGRCSASTTGCVPSLSIYPVAGRLVQALLCLMLFVTIILTIHMFRYSTGVFAEPSSIAGVATLFNHQDVVDDLRQARGTSDKHMQRYLARRRYRLGFHSDGAGMEKYGIVPQHVSVQPAIPSQKVGTNYTRGLGHPIIEESVKFKYPHLVSAVALICFLLCLLAIIVYYKLVFSTNGFERFMDSEGFGVRFLFTSIGVLIKLYWSSIFKDVMQLEAYRNLAKRNSSAKHSILIPSYSIPLTALPPAIKRGHFFPALLASAAFLADVLTVTLSNVQFKTATTWTAYTVCTWMSCAIIAVMILALAALVFHRSPVLLVKPDTIAAVLSLICWSSIPERFDDLAVASEKERNRKIGESELRYGIGNVRDENGQVRVGIEVEQLILRSGSE